MITLAEMTDLLGIRKPRNAVESPVGLVDFVEKGLPLKALDRLCARIAPSDATFKYRILSKAALARRDARLSAVQSTQVARLACIWLGGELVRDISGRLQHGSAA